MVSQFFRTFHNFPTIYPIFPSISSQFFTIGFDAPPPPPLEPCVIAPGTISYNPSPHWMACNGSCFGISQTVTHTSLDLVAQPVGLNLVPVRAPCCQW